MTEVGDVLLGVAMACAIADWFAVARNHARLEAIAKPLVMVALATAVAAADSPLRWLVASGLVFSLVGDVALLERIDKFIAGLGAFLIAHLLYLTAFVVRGSQTEVSGPRLFVGLAIAVLAVATIGRSIVRSASEDDQRLKVPVGAYVLALAAMLVAGWAVSAVAAIGATLFAASDAVLGWNRFVAVLQHGRLTTHVLYHLGQAGIAVWVIGL